MIFGFNESLLLIVASSFTTSSAFCSKFAQNKNDNKQLEAADREGQQKKLFVSY
jgi:hypothetical protein